MVLNASEQNSINNNNNDDDEKNEGKSIQPKRKPKDYSFDLAIKILFLRLILFIVVAFHSNYKGKGRV